MAPATALGRFFGGVLLGAALGAVYGFLGPLRRKNPHWADALFLPPLFACVVVFAFAVCQGAPRLGLLCAPVLGGIAWERTAGRLFRPLWVLIWGIVFRFFSCVQKNFKKIPEIGKKLFASGKKSSTIKENDHSMDIHDAGGEPNDDP